LGSIKEWSFVAELLNKVEKMNKSNRVKLFSLVLAVFLFQGSALARKPLIILDPAGSASHTGRKLASGYEQGEALRFTQSLAAKLKDAANVDVETSRAAGQEKGLHQTAAMANKLDADLVIHLSFYKEEAARPKLFIYHLIFNPVLDRTSYTDNQFAPVPLYQAHFRNKYQTKVIANTIKASLCQFENKKLFDVEGPFGIPTKPLVGICPPAITVEIGVNEETKADLFIDPLVESLKFIAR